MDAVPEDDAILYDTLILYLELVILKGLERRPVPLKYELSVTILTARLLADESGETLK